LFVVYLVKHARACVHVYTQTLPKILDLIYYYLTF